MKIKDMFKFTAKDKYRGLMQYIYFENDYAFATNGRVCLKANIEYPKEYEKSILTKKLDKIKGKFPPCNNLFWDTSNSDCIELSYDMNYFKRAIELYNKVKNDIGDIYYEVQLKVSNSRSYYLHSTIVEYVLKYLALYPNAKLYISKSRLVDKLQLEIYKNCGDSIFDITDTKKLDSAFVFMSDRLKKSSQIIYTAENKIYVENDSDYNKYFKDIPRSRLEDTGYIDMEMMEKYFKKYDLPSASEFKSNILSAISNQDILNIIEFDDYLHRKYGDYDKGENAKNLDDMFRELFGEDARLMASFFGVDRDNL